MLETSSGNVGVKVDENPRRCAECEEQEVQGLETYDRPGLETGKSREVENPSATEPSVLWFFFLREHITLVRSIRKHQVDSSKAV